MSRVHVPSGPIVGRVVGPASRTELKLADLLGGLIADTNLADPHAATPGFMPRRSNSDSPPWMPYWSSRSNAS